MSILSRKNELVHTMRVAIKNAAWKEAAIAIQEIGTRLPHVATDLMYNAVKDGDLVTYRALTQEGIRPAITEIEWAAGGGTGKRVEIMEDVIERFPDINFTNRDCLTLIFFSKVASPASWQKLFALCQKKNNFINAIPAKKSKILTRCLLCALKKDNYKLVEYLLDNILHQYLDVKSELRTPNVIKTVNKNKTYNSLPALIRHGLSLNDINFSNFLKKSHKNDRYLGLIERCGESTVTDVMFEASQNSKDALVVKMIDEHHLLPTLSDITKAKAIANSYLTKKGISPTDFLAVSGKSNRPELKAFALFSLNA